MAVRRRTLRLAAVPQLATTACDSVPGRSTLVGTPTTISRNTCCLVSRARGQLLGDVMGHAGTTSIVTLRVSPLPFDPSHAHIVGLQATTLGDRVSLLLSQDRAYGTVYTGYYKTWPGGSVAEWLACWTQTQGPIGSNRSRDGVG